MSALIRRYRAGRHRRGLPWAPGPAVDPWSDHPLWPVTGLTEPLYAPTQLLPVIRRGGAR